jgi:translation initiation factor 3 subunit E
MLSSPKWRGPRCIVVQERFNIGQKEVDALYHYAKCTYECGDYAGARELLHQYSTYSLDNDKIIAAMWGKLACEILTFNVRSAQSE